MDEDGNFRDIKPAPTELDVEAFHQRMEHILDDMDANPGASGYTSLIHAAWSESWPAEPGSARWVAQQPGYLPPSRG